MPTDTTVITSGPTADVVGTQEAARLMGLAVRSVQLMVDRGELQAWKTPGGHRRISRPSVVRWLGNKRPALENRTAPRTTTPFPKAARAQDAARVPRVLLIEDSIHFQSLVTLIVRRNFPGVNLRVASDAVTGLMMAGEFRPDVLIVDTLLPGMDGAALLGNLRSNKRAGDMQLVVITSLDAPTWEPYASALQDVRVIHKPALATELPAHLRHCLGRKG